MQTGLTILQIITGVLVVILVLLQDGKEGASLVAAESNNRGSMGSSNETRLANATKYVGLAFIILTIAVSTLMAINA